MTTGTYLVFGYEDSHPEGGSHDFLGVAKGREGFKPEDWAELTLLSKVPVQDSIDLVLFDGEKMTVVEEWSYIRAPRNEWRKLGR